MDTRKIKVVGLNTSTRDLSVWHFDAHDELCKAFCNNLVQKTGQPVFVIEGELIGRYELGDLPVKYIDEKQFT